MTEYSDIGPEHLTAVDLFCGGGGFSTGLALACEELDRDVRLIAVNHWTKAIETHKLNHEWAEHHNAKVESLHPPAVIGEDDVDILVAGPECTHFSTARGGKPVKEQKRASPWHVVDWIQKTRPDAVLVENVPELQSWGPIDEDGQPTRSGETFEAWTDAIHALGYSVDWDVLNAADYGDATTRRRLFIVARRGNCATHPDPTHSEDGTGELEEWRPAAEIIDWSDPGGSVWARSRPLSNNTMRRIAEGIREYCGDAVAEYADVLAEITQEDVEEMQSDTVAPTDVENAAETRDGPFIVEGPAVATDGGLPEQPPSMVMGQHSGAKAKDVTESPVPTIATKGAIHCIHTDPFILPRNGAYRGIHSNAAYTPDEQPLHTVTAKNHDGHLVWPFLVPYKSEREGQRPRTHGIDEPYPTVTATGSDPYLARPFLVEYYGNSDAQPVEEPLPTVTTKDRHALCVPDLFPWGLDLRYRMLQPRELAAAQGFPSDYECAGNKTETTEQIGNAVPVNLAKALVREALTGTKPSLDTYNSGGEVPADD
jgi:DNA (cytosine-5)-methyltransferase 1